ncbi:SUMF1/EgtB/PvdO family nonheme iron enzyme [Kaistella palustris]|uniref:SUMF1/EgtB/PvdO family nonheme iron enzyme n=1 Tax=Kaistella palustris TaxID=493376 RepID=UPI00041892CA|nr:SUMF1/EgtB/PvdO family nonheme iron enzyme [Kaistella palustris]
MNTKNYFQKIAFVALTFFGLSVQANNVQISGTSVDTATGQITFSLKWDNSWRTNIAPANHDAVWLFIKYQDCADKLWKHANLSVTSADHSAGGALKVDAVSDGKGVFIYRSSNGGGNISSTSVTLKMNVAAANYENYNFKVFGVEMVNIPQISSYWVGDGVAASAFTKYEITGNGSISSSAIGSGNSAPAAFPKGWANFYAMKYEISQEQYVNFLNTLTYGQQAHRSAAAPDSPQGTQAFGTASRNGIKIKVPGSNAAIPAVYGNDLTDGDFDDLNDGQNIAMSTLGYADVLAYLDWAALRPMSEIEFEKICRGPLAPVAGEYAWGTTEATGITPGGVVNGGQANEGYNTVTNGLANYGALSGYVPVNLDGPVKVGFSATNSSGRLSASAAYYGAMEMSGNVGEITVAAKTAGGSTYTGTLGDGLLSTTAATDGDADQATWPDNTGLILRGGHFNASGYGYSGNNSARMMISDRADTVGATRMSQYGGRGVR